MITMPIQPESRLSAPEAGFLRYAVALLAVAAATLAGLLVARHWGNSPVGLLFIPPVLATAVYGGLRPSLLATIAATLAYNYYFTEPYQSLMIHSPADVVTVLVLFLVAVVTSRLVGMLREQARLAADHAARNATIAGFARRLLSCADRQAIAEITVRELSALFQCNAVLIAEGDPPPMLASQPAGAMLAPSDLAAAALTLASGEPAGRGVQKINLIDWHFRPIASDQAVLAAAGLARDDGAPPFEPGQISLLGNLLDQAALAFERARLEHETREVAALRERDRLRSALLSSIGEDVKPSLNAIGAAARALKRDGSADKSQVASLSAEVIKLNRYVDSLVDLEPGGDRTPIQTCGLTIDLHNRAVRKDGTEVHLTPKEYAVLAELSKHLGRVLSHEHLLRVVWGPAHADQIDYLRVAIRALRQKLEADPARPALILNEPAVGYRLVAG